MTVNTTLLKFETVTYLSDEPLKWRGFLIQVKGHRLTPPNDTIIHVIHKKGGLKEGLIIGLSSFALIVLILIIGLITRWQLKKRYNKFDQLCSILKDMNLSPEEIVKMKGKSDELLIPISNIHINFDYVLGQGSSSTVYKGYLMGIAPLHLVQRSLFTQRFVDCNVAVKIGNKFEQDEVTQLFNEINAMKRIGYHENVMCMLGWVLYEQVTWKVYDIADKNALGFVAEFRDVLSEEVPYNKFLSILWQVARGRN